MGSKGRGERFDSEELESDDELGEYSPGLGVRPAENSKLAPRLWIYNRLLALRRRLPVHTVALYLWGGPAGGEVSRFFETSCGREIGVFTYWSFGLSRTDADSFLARSEPLAWAFAALGRPKDRNRRRLRSACMAKIASVDGLNDFERFLLFNCVATYLELGGGAAEEFAAQRALYGKPEVEMRPVTWEEKVEARGLEKGMERGLEKGMERGLEKGLEKGLERGKESGMREVLLRLLRSRFPSLTGQTVERIEAIRSPEELGSLAERLLTARSLEELGLA